MFLQKKKYLYDGIHVNKEGSILEAQKIAQDLQVFLNKNRYFEKLPKNKSEIISI